MKESGLSLSSKMCEMLCENRLVKAIVLLLTSPCFADILLVLKSEAWTHKDRSRPNLT